RLRLPLSPPLPYTTLFRSAEATDRRAAAAVEQRSPLGRHPASVLRRRRGAPARQPATRALACPPRRREAVAAGQRRREEGLRQLDRKSTRLNSSHVKISYA